MEEDNPSGIETKPRQDIDAPYLEGESKIVAARVCKVSFSDATDAWPEDDVYISAPDDTPHKISKKFGVDIETLVSENKKELPQLEHNSKLRGNTKIILPKREVRWLLARFVKKEKVGKKWMYTVEDIEPQDNKSKEFVVRKDLVQEYPQINNTYEKGEIVCALWAGEPEAYRNPKDSQNWITQFSMAIFEDYHHDPALAARATAEGRAPMPLARLKYENDRFNLSHDDPGLIRIVPISVIIKREKEKRSEAPEIASLMLPPPTAVLGAAGAAGPKTRRGEAVVNMVGGMGSNVHLGGQTEISIVDPTYPELGLRKFIYDSMVKRWIDSLDIKRRIHFRVKVAGVDPDARAEPSLIQVHYVEDTRPDPAAPPPQQAPPSPPRWTEEMLIERCKRGGTTTLRNGMVLRAPELDAVDMDVDAPGQVWSSLEEAQSESERAAAEGKPHMSWFYTDTDGAVRSWTARRALDVMYEPAPYVVLW